MKVTIESIEKAIDKHADYNPLKIMMSALTKCDIHANEIKGLPVIIDNTIPKGVFILSDIKF